MLTSINLDSSLSQTDFAELIGVSKEAVSKRVRSGALTEGASCRTWLDEYLTLLREEASGRSHENKFDAKHWAAEERKQNALFKEQARLIQAGDLVTVESVAVPLENFAHSINKGLMQVGREQTIAIRSKYEIDLDAEVIEKPLRDFLTDSGKRAEECLQSVCGIS